MNGKKQFEYYMTMKDRDDDFDIDFDNELSDEDADDKKLSLWETLTNTYTPWYWTKFADIYLTN